MLTRAAACLPQFTAPWCEDCKATTPAWDRLQKMYSNRPDASVSTADCGDEGKPFCDANGIRHA